MAKKSVGDKAKSDGRIPAGYGPLGDVGIKQTQSGGSKGGGIDANEFAKGIVGEPGEVDAIRDGKNQEAMDGDRSLLYGGGLFEREAVGLEDGVSVRETMNADSTEPNYNYDIDPMTGNAPERKVGRANNYTVDGKRGNKFLIGEM
jgi:hypothetical protein